MRRDAKLVAIDLGKVFSLADRSVTFRLARRHGTTAMSAAPD